VKEKIFIADAAHVDEAFGPLGAKVDSRDGPERRKQSDKEWWTLRRFLKPALLEGVIYFPLSIERGVEPDPDFRMDINGATGWIEITEATINVDQREFTLLARSDTMSLLGTFGGRYKGGAAGDRPERDWTSDILRAIRRKRKKSIVLKQDSDRHLIIYPSSNASILIDEADAFEMLRHVVDCWHFSISKMMGQCKVHVTGKNFICFDMLGKMNLLKLQSEIAG